MEKGLFYPNKCVSSSSDLMFVMEKFFRITIRYPETKEGTKLPDKIFYTQVRLPASDNQLENSESQQSPEDDEVEVIYPEDTKVEINYPEDEEECYQNASELSESFKEPTSDDQLESEENSESQQPPEDPGVDVIYTEDQEDSHHSASEFNDTAKEPSEAKEDSANSQPYECHICLKVFESEISQRDHLENSHAIKCSYCKETFLLPYALAKHLRVHLSDKGKLNCKSCQKEFGMERNLIYHFLRVHGRINKKDCKICETQLKDRRTLKIHYIVQHLKIKYFKCELCPDVFSYASNLKMHCKRVHQKPLSKAHLDFCMKNATKFHLSFKEVENEVMEKFGISKTAKDTSEPYKCPHCEETFRTKLSRSKHKIAHFSDNELNCKKCKISFADRKTQLKHIKNHEPNSIQFPCKVCGDKFPYKCHLKSHYLGQHVKTKMLKCEHCPFGSNSVHILKQHYGNVHNKKLSKSRIEFCKKKLQMTFEEVEKLVLSI